MKNTLMRFMIITLILMTQALIIAGDKKSVEYLNSKQHQSLNLPFSEAVRVGDILFLSGQLGMNPKTGKLVSGGMKAEAKQTMQNIKATLNKFGYSMKDVVKCTVMLADISKWGEFNDVYVSFFSKPFPARSAFGANGLAVNAALEVECIAAKVNDPEVTLLDNTNRNTLMKVKGKFDVTLQPKKAYAESADGIRLARMTIDKVFHGELEATSQGEMLSAMTAVKGSAGYVAIEQVVGTLSGKKGSFALQHFGTMEKGEDYLQLEVIPDSGSGELSGLSGSMSIIIEDGQHYYEFDFSL